MDTADSAPDDDLKALELRRERLRVFAARVADAVEAIDMPLSYLEACHAARCVTTAWRMIVRLPQPGSDIRSRLRLYADRLLGAATALPMPETFVEGERAARCTLVTDRMLRQLYEAPKLTAATPEFADIHDAESADDPEARDKIMTHINNQTYGYAYNCGVWPDGTPFDRDTPFDYEAFDETLDLEPETPDEAQDEAPEARERDLRLMARVIIGRVNAITRAQAQGRGHWPDMSPYAQDDPDYYSISSDFERRVINHQRGARSDLAETSGPVGFPWWLVRKPPT